MMSDEQGTNSRTSSRAFVNARTLQKADVMNIMQSIGRKITSRAVNRHIGKLFRETPDCARSVCVVGTV